MGGHRRTTNDTTHDPPLFFIIDLVALFLSLRATKCPLHCTKKNISDASSPPLLLPSPLHPFSPPKQAYNFQRWFRWSQLEEQLEASKAAELKK